MTRRWLTTIALATTVLAAGQSGSQELSRDAQWGEDLDFLIDHLEVIHPNLYACIPEGEFHELAARLKQGIPTATDVEMFYGIQELVARIRNDHTMCNPTVFNLDGNERLKAQFHYYPVMYYPFSDGLFIYIAAQQYEAILGKRVVRMGGLTTADVMRELARFVGADNENAVLANIPRFYLIDGQLLRHVGASDSPDSLALTLANDDGTTFDYVVRTDPEFGTDAMVWYSMAESEEDPPLYRKNRYQNYWFEYLPAQRAVYLQINLMNDIESDPFPAFCGRLFDALDENGAEKLIIDVRGCPGGDHIELPLLEGILARPRIDRPDRLFLIIGRVTGSAAQHLTSELQHYTGATLFGEATGSKPNQYGAMQKFTLPHSKIDIVCALKYFQDAEPSDYSTASTPDIHVSPSSDDYRNNRDPVLERIFDYDSYKQLRPELRASLSKAYADGGIDGFKAAYESVKAEYAENGFNMETLLYDDLDAWMSHNSKSEDDYVAYLKFIHGELPNSIPVCYDLAYWMNKRGDRREARRLWERCLVLNPEHHNAKWRLGLMRLDEKWSSAD